jgi:chromosome segregation ATPase
MANVITTDLESGERQAERDLGAIVNEVEHLTAQLAEHTTTIEGFREDRSWINSRLEALERDLAALPKVPNELATSLLELTSRIERLESSSIPESEEHTEAPEREEHRESAEEPRAENGERKKSRSLLDGLF